MGADPCLSVADHHVGAVVEDGLNQSRDVATAILIVGVGVDDDIRTGLQGRIEAGGKGRREPSVAAMTDDVIDARFASHHQRGVGAAVVDDQRFKLVDPGDVRWEIGQRLGQRRLFVVARDLDDQFQGLLAC